MNETDACEHLMRTYQTGLCKQSEKKGETLISNKMNATMKIKANL